MILGIDEVGRGPWAGPLVIGAVVLGDAAIEGLNDSKKLTKAKRELLDVLIREQAAGYGLGWVSADELDRVGLPAALRLATIRAVEQIKAPYHEIIIDGTINFLKETNKGPYVTLLKKADSLIPAVSAASIIAKVARDRFMAEQDQTFPGYSFGSHVGYGTAIHQKAITELGLTPLHRRSFAPIRKVVESAAVTTKAVGDAAEEQAADYLIAHDHEILERNWKTKWCEIDIVSRKNETAYFHEVKYRSGKKQGGGMAAITPRKIQQMSFAADFYAVSYKRANDDRQLTVIAVTSKGVESYIELSEGA